MSQASKPPVLDERPAADNHVLPPSPGKDRQAGVLSRRSLLKASAAVGGLGLGLLGVPATSAAQLSADSSAAMRPFRVAFAKEALDDLRRRIAATRWPSRETVADESQGVRLATMQQLARYWMTDYDWRKAEAKLNALPQFVTTIDGGGHPFHSRAFQACQRAAAHRHARLARLGHRAVEDHRAPDPSHGPRRTSRGCLRRRHPVDSGVRILRKADHDRLGPGPHRTCLDRADEAAGLHEVRGARRRLGGCGLGADGAAGCAGTARHPREHAGHRSRRRVQGAQGRRTGACGPVRRRVARVRATGHLLQARAGLCHRDGEPPADAVRHRGLPVGLAAWILDHDARSQALIARVFAEQTEGLTRDDILDNITLYWLTQTAISSARLYWENKLAFFDVKNVSIPVAVRIFPDEIYAAPRSWAQGAYPKLIHYNKLDKGGHFAASEQPKVFAEELRAGFRPLRAA